MSQQQSFSPWSVRIAQVRGIPIRIHFTFLLFLVWIAVVSRMEGSLMLFLLITSVFACILLHELGHALTARSFGIGIRDITLYPIGGVAMLKDRPNAKQEFWITIAGPSVNLVIATILGVVFVAQGGKPQLLVGNFSEENLLAALFQANVFIFLFNMIPAFPMDGGRILRSALAMKLSNQRATDIAGNIGQALAILFGFIGLFYGHIFLMVIALFVYVGAGNEMSAARGAELTQGHTVKEAMMTNFAVLQHGDSLGRAADLLLAGSQTDFPVLVGDDVVGVLGREDLIRGLQAEGKTGYIAGFMKRDWYSAQAEEPLLDIVKEFANDRQAVILVMENERLAGLLNLQNVNEFMMLAQVGGLENRLSPKFEI